MARITAKFERMADASNAVKALKNNGFNTAWLDAADDFSSEFAAAFNFPGTGSAPSLSGLVMNSGGYSSRVDKGPLLAANPMVSGMDSHDDHAKNHSTRLVMKAPDDQLEAAKKIITDMGGEISFA